MTGYLTDALCEVTVVAIDNQREFICDKLMQQLKRREKKNECWEQLYSSVEKIRNREENDERFCSVLLPYIVWFFRNIPNEHHNKIVDYVKERTDFVNELLETRDQEFGLYIDYNHKVYESK